MVTKSGQKFDTFITHDKELEGNPSDSEVMQLLQGPEVDLHDVCQHCVQEGKNLWKKNKPIKYIIQAMAYQYQFSCDHWSQATLLSYIFRCYKPTLTWNPVTSIQGRKRYLFLIMHPTKSRTWVIKDTPGPSRRNMTNSRAPTDSRCPEMRVIEDFYFQNNASHVLYVICA